LVLLPFCGAAFSALAAEAPPDEPRRIAVHFSPRQGNRGGCLSAVIEAIEGAQTRVFVQSYTFTSGPICLALRNAHARGVRVEVLIDRGEAFGRPWLVEAMQDGGIAMRLDATAGLAHNKVMLVDDDIVLTGSFNWTHNAEFRNQENLLIIRDREVFAQYLRNWDRCNQGATPFVRPPREAVAANVELCIYDPEEF